MEPYGFQADITVQRAQLEAQANTEKGLVHTAVLDLEKAYDKVYRVKLIQNLARCLERDDPNMVRFTLRALTVRTRGDPTGCAALLTRGVPQEAPSSPVYFNAYIDELAYGARRRTCGRANERKVILVADDVLMQATTKQNLQHLLDAAKWWKKDRDVTWSLPKCSYLQLPEGQTNGTVYLDMEPVMISNAEVYLGVTLHADGLRPDRSIQRIENAGQEMDSFTNSGWWSMNLRPSQVALAFNAIGRAK